MWCGVVWCGVVWCGVVWCGVVLCGVVWCGVVCVVLCCAVLCRAVLCCAVLCCAVVVWCGVRCGFINPLRRAKRAPRGLLFLALSGLSLVSLAFSHVLSFSLAFSCFASVHVLWHFVLNGVPRLPLLSLAFPCVPLAALALFFLPCTETF